MKCGRVIDHTENGALCGEGFSVCTDGEWAECIIDNAISLMPSSPPGYFTEKLSPGIDCINNPCDPNCVDYPDDPTGTFDAGSTLDSGDAGVWNLGEGGSVCVPKTCADLGKNCGPVSDGCGHLLQCGTCSSPYICGLEKPNICGVPMSCTNLCLKQVSCPGAGTTSISGKVYAPNGTEALPNAIVYVPNAAVAPFSSTVSCDNCLMASGSPLVSTTSAADGTFTLTNMPVGINIPLVIQIGRWRRQVTIPSVAACTNTALASSLTRLPKSSAEGDIPRMAFVTGQVDSMECVWRKIGIADSEFTTSSGTGRIHLYKGGQKPGAYITSSNNTPSETALLGNPTTLANYDMVLFPCQGLEYHYTASTHKAYQKNLADYANAGGRIFATHYSYIWLYADGTNFFSPLAPAVNWAVGSSNPTPDPGTGYIDTSFAKGSALATWLKAMNASSTLGQISVNTLRRDFASVVSPTQRWLYVLGKANVQIPLHLTFNTPLGAAAQNQCGRVVFSDFHVEDASDANKKFPTECDASAMTPQEKLLEYMLFDLASCVQPDNPVQGSCTPVGCSAQGLNCGPAGDGCGGVLDCGSCAAPATCGGGGQSGVCGTPFAYYDGYFVRDYDATTKCKQGTTPKWNLWSWTTVTPSNTRIEFTVQTAATAAGLANAPKDTVVFSQPPGPAALVGSPAIAHASGVPAGAPDTQLGSALIDATLEKYGRTRDHRFLRITSHLVPSTDKQKSPLLVSWDLQMSCRDSE